MITELSDIQRRLVSILHNARKDNVNRRILVLIGGMIAAINTIMRLVRLDDRKKKILERQEKSK